MTREPLRPLASVIATRQAGQNPDVIEARQRAKRNFKLAQKTRIKAENRLLFLACVFVMGFAAISGKMAIVANSKAEEPQQFASASQIVNQRADIVDRRGRVLATNLSTRALYAQPHKMVDPKKAADDLYKLFPDLDHARLLQDFTGGKRKFIWIKKSLSPEQRQMVHDLGEPGLQFGDREMRLYPNGKLAAHILGGTRFGEEGVRAAEVVGVAGVEKYFDAMLRDPALEGRPLRLSIDISAQAAMREVLEDGMVFMDAKGASGILMDAYTGEIRAMVSLPDFDPNDRPRPATSGDPSESPLFNRAAQGLYELGSTFKSFTVASSLDAGLVTATTLIDTTSPLKWGGVTIKDHDDNSPAQMSVADVLARSSNVGTARMALTAGTGTQKRTLEQLGFFEPVSIELPEAKIAKPLIPSRWSDVSTITISYGHGLSASPLHLAQAYAPFANGGFLVTPTLKELDISDARTDRVMSAQSAQETVRLMRRVVQDDIGTASMAHVAGYDVAGKTGTADKPNPKGGYYEDRVIASFASVFPAADPKYVLVVSLDEPSIEAFGEERRTAGWTAAPVAGEVIARVAPILNVTPVAQIASNP